MKILIFKLVLWRKDLIKKVTVCNRIINNSDVKELIKWQKNTRRNACKMIIEIDQAIEILK